MLPNLDNTDNLSRGEQLKLLRTLVIPKLQDDRETVSGGVAKAVLRCVDDRAGKASLCRCKLETIAKESCFGKTTTGRAIRLLKKAGYLSGSMKMGQGQRLILRVNWQAISDSAEELENEVSDAAEELESDVSDSSAVVSDSSAVVSDSSAVVSDSSEELRTEAPPKRNEEAPLKRTQSAAADFSQFVTAWNEKADRLSYPKVVKLTADRKKKLNVRLKDDPDWAAAFFEGVAMLPIKQWKDWTPTFDWMIKNGENVYKLVEGHYHRKQYTQSDRNRALIDEHSERGPSELVTGYFDERQKRLPTVSTANATPIRRIS